MMQKSWLRTAAATLLILFMLGAGSFLGAAGVVVVAGLLIGVWLGFKWKKAQDGPGIDEIVQKEAEAYDQRVGEFTPVETEETEDLGTWLDGDGEGWKEGEDEE